MTVDTRELVSEKEGLVMCSRSTAILLSAVLSSTTTASAFSVSRFSVSRELYGCTTTSLAAVSFWFGNTLRMRKQRDVVIAESSAVVQELSSISLPYCCYC